MLDADARAATQKRPDYRISSLTGLPATVSPGQSLSLKYVLRQRGGKRRAVTTGFYLSKDTRFSKDDTRLAGTSRKTPSRRGTAKARMSLPVPGTTTPGRWFVLACADYVKKLRERNERNNCRVSPEAVTVLSPPFGNPLPDPTPNPDPNPNPNPDPDPGPDPATVDSDGDGTVDANDCAPNDPAVAPGKPDPLDASYVDSDCDGYDGTVAGAVLVQGSGDDSGPCGSPAAPCRNISTGITRATALGKTSVWVSGGTFNGFMVQRGIDVAGGFGSNFQRNPALTTGSTETIVNGGLDPVLDFWWTIRASGISDPTRLSGLTVNGPDVTDQGESSYAVYVTSSPDLTLSDVDIVAGDGGDGTPGTNGQDFSGGAANSGTEGGDGDEETRACDRTEHGLGGGAGAGQGMSNLGGGGAGGAGGEMDTNCTVGSFDFDATDGDVGGNGRSGNTGNPISNTGGTAGTGATTCSGGGPGTPGGPGTDAAGGSGATVGGFLIPGRWSPNGGSAGSANGGIGHGGGGGGGSGGCDNGTDSFGAGGGGGGAGGVPATVAGTGGGGGGASFGIFAIDSTIALAGVTITRGVGGDGGDGGKGGAGQAGGTGAPGGLGVGTGNGGKGGDGGRGGASGGGGGGAGGDSIGALLSSSTLTGPGGALTISGGSAGSRGDGGTAATGGGNPGGNGANGRVLNQLTL